MTNLNGSDFATALHAAADTSAPLIALGVSRRTVKIGDTACFAIPLSRGSLDLFASRVGNEVSLWIEARDSEQARVLRNILVSHGGLRSKPHEHIVLGDIRSTEGPQEVLRSIAGWAQALQTSHLRWARVTGKAATTASDEVLGYWWDSRANFGDAAGPWLIEAMTGSSAINVRKAKTKGRAIASIGSLVQMMDRGRVDFWGSGILYPPSENQIKRLKGLQGVAVHAVRGSKTRAVVQEALGWEVPEIYGDPALLFPRYFRPERGEASHIAFVPHKHHRKLFKKRIPESVNMLNVADDVQTVVAGIATAEVCISTSLHGIIFAQAYGVPWVWLNVKDDELKGGAFKFDDFFSTLDASSVARVDVAAHELSRLNLDQVAGQARLPELTIDLDLLEEAFPLPKAENQNLPAGTSFNWKKVSSEDRAAAYARAAYRRQRQLRKRLSASFSG